LSFLLPADYSYEYTDGGQFDEEGDGEEVVNTQDTWGEIVVTGRGGGGGGGGGGGSSDDDWKD